MGITGFYWVLKRFKSVLLGFASFCGVLMGLVVALNGFY